MNTKYSIYTILTALVLTFSSCAKDPIDPDGPEPTPTPVNTSDFRWNVNNGTTVVADSGVYYPKFTTIYGYKSGTLNTVEINLSDLVVGSYQVSSVTGNQLTYVSNGSTFAAKSGTVNITSNSANLISGDFNCGMTGGAITTISGQFKDLKYR